MNTNTERDLILLPTHRGLTELQHITSKHWVNFVFKTQTILTVNGNNVRLQTYICIIIIWTEGLFQRTAAPILLALESTENTENAAVLNQRTVVSRRSRSLRPHSKSSSRALAKLWRVDGCKAKNKTRMMSLLGMQPLIFSSFCQKTFYRSAKL